MKIFLSLIIIATFYSPVNAQIISVNLLNYQNNNQDTVLMDGIGVFFGNQYSDTVDLNDARDLTNPLENFAIKRNNILLGIEKRTSYDSIPLIGFRLNPTLIHELKIVKRSINKLVILQDVDSNKLIPMISDTLKYTFNVGCDSTRRFRLLFTNILAVHLPDLFFTPNIQNYKTVLYPNPISKPNNFFYIKSNEMPTGRYLINIVGVNNINKSFNIVHQSSKIDKISVDLPPGYYFIVINNEQGFNKVKQVFIY